MHTLRIGDEVNSKEEERMAVHGQLTEFEPSKEDWQSYVERMTQCFTANEITMALDCLRRSTYRMIKNIVAPLQPSEKTFDEIVTLISERYKLKPMTTVQWYFFNSRMRKSGEGI